MRDKLAGGSLSEVNTTLAKLVESRGQTLLDDAHRKLSAGLITEQAYKAIEHERRRG